MRKVLIINAVPVNNGDAALVLALYGAMKERGLEVAIATHRYELVQNYYPKVNLVKDLLDYPIIKKSRFLKYLLIPFLILFLKQYREADTIVGAPGGYVNSYYGIFDKLYVLFICKLLGKKTAIYSQSIGPLNAKDAKRFSFFTRYIDLLYVRDQISYDIATGNSVGGERIRLTEDAAFLLTPDFSGTKNGKKVAVSVRDWAFDNRDRERYYSLIAELVKICARKGYAVEFISTCQGVPGYVDDSQVADKIVRTHLDGIDDVTILHGRFTLDEFRSKLREYDFVIGTRLHMCILSMLNGIPAFNISYEIKGKECYAYLGLSEISVDYNDEQEKAVEAFEYLVSNMDMLRQYVRERIAASHSDAVTYFEQFCVELERQ